MTNLADRVRPLLPRAKVTEKRMMGGLTFMVDGKMCVGVLGDDLMVRLDPSVYQEALGWRGARPMDFTKKPMRGFLFVGPEGTKSARDLSHWIATALAFNPKAKSSRRKP
jgi:TfoX/Sxy family transcriptional regulator of competence genes